MKTKEEFESYVSSLTELEMSDLLDSCASVLVANRWNQLKKSFEDSEEIEDLQYEISKLEDKLSEAENDLEDVKSTSTKALECLIEGNTEKAKKLLSEI